MPGYQAGYELINRVRWKYAFAASFTFLCGIAIYAFFRNLNILFFQIFSRPAVLDTLQIPVSPTSIWLSMFLFNLPDGLWFLSGFLLIRAVWLANPRWRVIYACLFSIAALAIEISQVFDSIPGTFDLLDIAFMAFFAISENVFFNMFIKRKERKR